MTDHEPTPPVKQCDACFAEFTGDGELCPDCQSQYDQTHDENGNLTHTDHYDREAQ